MKKNMHAMKTMIVILSIATATGVRAATYDLDPTHTEFGFGVKHMAVSTVKGSFGEFAGSFEYDAANPEAFRSTTDIQVKSVNTGNEKRDAHLRDADFFDAENFPLLTFTGEGLEKTGDGYLLKGNLTIKETTKAVSIPVTISGPVTDPWGNERIGIEGSFTIDRQEYGLAFNGKLETGELVVADKVKITIATEGIRRK